MLNEMHLSLTSLKAGTVCVIILIVILTTVRTQDLQLSYTLIEEEPIDTVIGDVPSDANLIDIYGSDLAFLQYSIITLNSKYANYFSIDESSGLLTTALVVDRDQPSCLRDDLNCYFDVTIGVLDPNLKFAVIKVQVEIIDKNDNAPRFPEDEFILPISEAMAAGTTFVLPEAEDIDSGENSVKDYELQDGSGVFVLRHTTDGPLVELLRSLDRESVQEYSLLLLAHDGGSPRLTGTLPVKVVVNDANDNPPNFISDLYNVVLPENAEIGTTVVQVEAVDIDEGENGHVTYDLESQTKRMYSDTFELHSESGEIVLKKSLDISETSSYRLEIIARDAGTVSNEARSIVMVNVDDVNDHAPAITLASPGRPEGDVVVPENSAVGSFVASVFAEDRDIGANAVVHCSVEQGPFDLEPLFENAENAFALTTTQVLDRESRQNYVITIECGDSGDPPLSTVKRVTVKVDDRNDNQPVFRRAIYDATSLENSTVGTQIIQVTADDIDSGANGQVVYSLSGINSDLLRITNDGSISTAVVLDYEQLHWINVTVTAIDGGDVSFTSTALVNIRIEDTNDEAPIFLEKDYEFALFENEQAGTEIGFVGAVDNDSPPFDIIVYVIEGDSATLSSFFVEEYSGKIITKRPLDREEYAVHTFDVVAYNPDKPGLRNQVRIVIRVADQNDNPPIIAFPSIFNNTVHIPLGLPRGYFFTRITATDADDAQSSKLTYSLAPESDRLHIFNIDRLTGAVSVVSDLDKEDAGLHRLLVLVLDGGDPPLTAMAELNVIVNQSIPYFDSNPSFPGGSHETISRGGLLTRSETIVISLGIITMLVATSLITAIVLVRRRREKFEDNNSMPMSPTRTYDDIRSSTRASNQKSHINEHAVIEPRDPKLYDNQTFTQLIPEREGDPPRQQTSGTYNIPNSNLASLKHPWFGLDRSPESRWDAGSNSDSGHGISVSEDGRESPMHAVQTPDIIKHQEKSSERNQIGENAIYTIPATPAYSKNDLSLKNKHYHINTSSYNINTPSTRLNFNEKKSCYDKNYPFHIKSGYRGHYLHGGQDKRPVPDAASSRVSNGAETADDSASSTAGSYILDTSFDNENIRTETLDNSAKSSFV